MVPRASTRPVFRSIPDRHAVVPTTVEIIERMSGDAMLRAADGGMIRARVELTMHFEPRALASLFLPGERTTTCVCDAARQGADERRLTSIRKSRLRVFIADDWDAWRRRAGRDAELDEYVQYSAPIKGSLAFMHREPSTYRDRWCRALRAWFFNRGTRDTWQAVVQLIANRRAKIKPLPLAPGAGNWRLCTHLPFLKNSCRRFAEAVDQLVALASHAGEVRLFEYNLTIIGPGAHRKDTSIDVKVFDNEDSITGRKRLTYSRRSNPWWQMIRMSLDKFPGFRPQPPPVLELDTNYLTQQGAPILRVLGQSDEPAAIADLASVAAYFLRLLMCIHVWSFRKPDPADPGEPQRLPGIVKGLPAPEISEICVAKLPNGREVKARLTRYARPASVRPPILLIPGYSASGTTFAHPALDPHAAGFFRERGRDVWILDMRTSCGMPTARMPWTFEDAALADIPAAVNFIWHATERQRRIGIPDGKPPRRIDVFAHCMGSVMFSMALLARPASGDTFYNEREALPARIGKVVLSQIGPVVVFTPANIFRAYMMSYLRAFLPLANYEFRIGPAPSLDRPVDRSRARRDAVPGE